MRFTAAELAEMNLVGASFNTISFYSSVSEGESVYVVVGTGNEMLLRKDVTSQYTPDTFITIDISDENILIPEGKDVYIGYGVDGLGIEEYPFCAYGPFTEDHGGIFCCKNFLTNSTWSRSYFSSGYFDPIISATVSPIEEVEFSVLGVSYIKVENGVPTVEVAAGKSLKKTDWFLDGVSVETPTAINDLSTGSHTYMVRLTYYDGTSERVYYDVDKQ